jgi:peptidyl-tRNA hydrolase, PTH1 family
VLPADIPKNIEVDISHLVFGVEVRVKDLPHSDKLKFLTDENQMIAHITTVKEEVVAAPEVVADASGRLRLNPKSSRRASRKSRVKRPRAMPRVRPSPRRPKSLRRKRRNSFWQASEAAGRCFSLRRAKAMSEKLRAKSESCVKLIVGLGNPGIEYQFTPHNLGFLTIDRIANGLGIEVRNRQCRALTARATIAGEPVVLAKPETYMNLSGLSVRELVAEHQVDVTRDLIVIYDELDLPLGTIRIRQRGGSAGHNGMESILGALGTDEFLRIRLGIAPDRKVVDGVKYVLTPFRKAQEKVVDEMLDTAAQAVEVILKEGPAAAMNRFNRKNEAEEG